MNVERNDLFLLVKWNIMYGGLQPADGFIWFYLFDQL